MTDKKPKEPKPNYCHMVEGVLCQPVQLEDGPRNFCDITGRRCKRLKRALKLDRRRPSRTHAPADDNAPKIDLGTFNLILHGDTKL